MSSTQQVIGSNESGRGMTKESGGRRSWSEEEDAVLLASLKELCVQGWKSDNSFRAGYLNKLQGYVTKAFPDANIKVTPHITSKLTGWKRTYYTLMGILKLSGVGFNLNGDYKIDCDNAKWEDAIRADSNAKNMRGRSWPLFRFVILLCFWCCKNWVFSGGSLFGWKDFFMLWPRESRCFVKIDT